MREYPAHLFVADLGKRWVHHQDQSNGDGNGSRADTEPIQKRNDSWKDIAPQDTHSHGQEDPESQKPIQEGKFFRNTFIMGSH